MTFRFKIRSLLLNAVGACISLGFVFGIPMAMVSLASNGKTDCERWEPAERKFPELKELNRERAHLLANAKVDAENDAIDDDAELKKGWIKKDELDRRAAERERSYDELIRESADAWQGRCQRLYGAAGTPKSTGTGR